MPLETAFHWSTFRGIGRAYTRIIYGVSECLNQLIIALYFTQSDILLQVIEFRHFLANILMGNKLLAQTAISFLYSPRKWAAMSFHYDE